MTKWILSSLSVLLFVVILFINVGNNSEFNDEFNTNLSNVSNDEMEAVILENPDIHPMRTVSYTHLTLPTRIRV